MQLISSAFEPLLGDRANGVGGKVIDMLAIFATLFGSAASLGLGALQIRSGLHIVAGHQRDGQHGPRRHHHGAHRGVRAVGRFRRRPGHPVAVEHQHGAGHDAGAVRIRRRPNGFHPQPAANVARQLLPGPGDDVGAHGCRGRRRRHLAAVVDDLLLGVVDLLDAVRRHVHRADLAGPHHPSVRHRRAAGAKRGVAGVVRSLRRRGDQRPAGRRGPGRRGQHRAAAVQPARPVPDRHHRERARDGAGGDLLRVRVPTPPRS